jgi:diamine N-acetyltransferase
MPANMQIHNNTVTMPAFNHQTMIITTKNNKQVLLRRLNTADLGSLYDYLQNLSAETKKRFGPHSFEKQAIIDFYTNASNPIGYIGIDIPTNEIIAYSIIKIGFIEHDGNRLRSYGITPDHKTDVTFAPSVADSWQSCGIGNEMFKYILSDLKNNVFKRIILWGGVQMDNGKAVSYYKKNGFKILGQFTHNGENYDMMHIMD